MITILRADARSIPLADESVDCVVTSPPYWGLRDYGVEGQLGLERLHDCLGWARGSECQDCHVCAMRRVFREVHRVLKPAGTLWLNYGDCYNAYNGGAGPSSSLSAGAQTSARPRLSTGYGLRTPGLKPKDLVGMAWRIAFALQADGWWLRNDIIWSKPNPMPDSTRDRATKSHEYLFLLSKAQRYHFDYDAWLEPCSPATVERVTQPGWAEQAGSTRANAGGKTNGPMKAVARGSGNKARKHGADRDRPGSHLGASVPWEPTGEFPKRNRRTVWTLTTSQTSEAHFATFPEALVEPCILAGCPAGGIVLDPFCGSGTTLAVANRLGRSGIGLELNPEYIEIARRRVFADVTPTREEKASGQKLLLEAL